LKDDNSAQKAHTHKRIAHYTVHEYSYKPLFFFLSHTYTYNTHSLGSEIHLLHLTLRTKTWWSSFTFFCLSLSTFFSSDRLNSFSFMHTRFSVVHCFYRYFLAWACAVHEKLYRCICLAHHFWTGLAPL
jgi:hypothetical protein